MAAGEAGQACQGVGEVAAAEAEADVVAGVAEHRPGQEQDPLGLHQRGGERVGVQVGAEPWEPDRADI